MHGEQDLEEGGAGEVPLRPQLLDQGLEREILMAIGGQRGLAHPVQHVAEGRLGPEVHPEHQRVDEEADKPLGLRPVAVGDGGADQHVLLARVPGQQDVEAGEKEHEERHPLAPAERLEPGARLLRDAGPAARAVERLDGGPREVGGQIEARRRARQLAAPVVELAREHLAGQPAPLPDGEVGVLHRQLGQRRRAARGEGLVQRHQLAQQDVHGPPVRNDVVHGQQQGVPLLPELQQRRLEERPRIERERPPGQAPDQGRGLPAPVLPGEAREIGHGQREPPGRRDRLVRPGVGGRKGRAQGFVPAHDLSESVDQGRDVERSPDLERVRDVVGHRAGRELGEEPEPALGEGERQGIDARRALDARRLQGSPGVLGRLDGAREAGDRRMLEDAAQRQLYLEGPPHARDGLGRQQGMPAEVEEVVVDPHRRQLQDLGPDAGQDSCVGVEGAVGAAVFGCAASGAGRARRSTLPVGDRGRASRNTQAEGIMYSGRRSRR